jgi:hypothetical protein
LDNLGRFSVQRISYLVQQGEASEAMAWLYIDCIEHARRKG